MVERINKPEAPPPHRVGAAKEAKEDQSKREHEREEERKYQKSKMGGDWKKFRGRAMTIKPVKVPRERIDRVLFRNALLRGGICILEASIIWKDGRKTEPALFILPRPEDFMRLKGHAKGQLVAETFWARGPEIEIGIVQAESPSGSWGIQEMEQEHKEEQREKAKTKKPSSILAALGLADKTTGQFQWTVFILYLMGLVIIALMIMYASQ